MKFDVKVVPNAKKAEVIKGADGVLKVKVNAPARQGKANRMLKEILSEYFKMPKSSIRIVKGLLSRNKIVEIE